ncbi:ubiquitin-like domain-containing protein [Actinopolymorpha sp. NPDC004070]|uniref:ubiquitin-like domain-containing protein n=1 Tax=Actinopolymorpha sp. NPDC004070 TaxID=3154548 RepID=UPI0033A627C6
MSVPGKHDHRSTVHKKVLIGAIGIGVVGALGIGGTTAYASLNKSVTVSIDGKAHNLHTFDSTVGDVLASQKIKVGPRDVVAPARTAKVTDGTRIAVRYARPLTLNVDGSKQTRWVTAMSLGEALNDLGGRFDGARTSASRGVGIARQGLTVDVITRKTVVISHDGKKTPLDEPLRTVSDALAKAQVKVDADDRVKPSLSTEVKDGTAIVVNRVDVRKSTRKVALSYDTIHKKTSTLYKGHSKVGRTGHRGEKAQVFRTTFVDGKKVKTQLLSQKVVRQPVDTIVLDGTKVRRSSSGSSGGGGSGGGSSSGGGGNVGGGVDSLNWAALAQCESSGNPRAVNPSGYYGLYQFSLSTWHSVGGSGNPIDNSSAEQTYRAKLLYKKAGAGQWSCGSHLYD